MTTITLEVSDRLSAKLERVKDHLPQLLERSLEQPGALLQAYHYVMDFLISQPTAEQIAAFRATPEMIERTRVLLARERAGTATPDEKAELDEYERLQHIVIMLKAGNIGRYLR